MYAQICPNHVRDPTEIHTDVETEIKTEIKTEICGGNCGEVGVLADIKP